MENYRLRLALHTPALRGSSRTHRGGTGKGKFPFLLTASPPPTTWARRSVFIIRKGALSVLSEWPRTVLYEHREDIRNSDEDPVLEKLTRHVVGTQIFIQQVPVHH